MVVKVKILDVNGRLIEVRLRKNRRIAVREADLPSPPPSAIALMCAGERLEVRLVARQFGFAIYYMPAAFWRRLLELTAQYDAVPCVLAF
jgi:hypothetical protein